MRAAGSVDEASEYDFVWFVVGLRPWTGWDRNGSSLRSYFSRPGPQKQPLNRKKSRMSGRGIPMSQRSAAVRALPCARSSRLLMVRTSFSGACTLTDPRDVSGLPLTRIWGASFCRINGFPFGAMPSEESEDRA